jgi:outer membrane receptor protein involved in Fe transport
VGGFAVVNANLLSRNLGRHTELSAGLYNLFDKNYADPAPKSTCRTRCVKTAAIFA